MVAYDEQRLLQPSGLLHSHDQKRAVTRGYRTPRFYIRAIEGMLVHLARPDSFHATDVGGAVTRLEVDFMVPGNGVGDGRDTPGESPLAGK